MRYSSNHMWIDTHDDGSCHVGIDAFLATFLQCVQGLSYVTTRSVCFPSAVLTVNGVDLQLVFPLRIQVTGINAYLRARPSALTTHPYSLGWLFEGRPLRTKAPETQQPNDPGIVTAAQAQRWMRQESKRLTDYVHSELLVSRTTEFATMADGGTWSNELITHVTREELLQIWNAFFSVAPQNEP